MTQINPLDSSELPAAPKHLPPRLMLISDDETAASRWFGVSLAWIIAAAYLFMILQFWAPAHGGVDQNGYLVGGKQLAATGSTGLLPEHPLGFVGAMWVRVAETGVNYPKYPNGLPLLYAMSIWIFGSAQGGPGFLNAFLVSPISAGLSVLGMYYLARQFAGVFASIGAMLLIATSQVMLLLANNPNSHASCLACVIWGIYFLVRFWQTAAAWRGFIGGFLIGYAATIRYTEGLLALLIAIVGVSMVRWTSWRSYVRCAWPTIGWLIPVGYLVIFNLVAMGTPTGYDTTNESKFGAAFTLDHIWQNWEKLIRQVHDSGLFFSAPIGLLGMFIAWKHGWRRAAILWAWLIPGTLIYMSYYWAPDRGVSYLRFFLTLLPPIAIGAAIVFDELSRSLPARRLIATIGIAGILAMSCGLGMYRSITGLEDGQETNVAMETQHRSNANLAALGQVVTKTAPPGSVLFATPQQLHYLQFIGNYECFSPEYFTTNFARRLEQFEAKTDEANDPMTQQGERRRWLLSVVENRSESYLITLQNELIEKSLADKKRVFYVLTKRWYDASLKRFSKRDSAYEAKLVARYDDMPRVEPDESSDKPSTEPMRKMMGSPKSKQPKDNPQPWQIVEIVRKQPVVTTK